MEDPIIKGKIKLTLKKVCQYGGSERRLCNNDICHVCFDKSFASNPKSQYWSNKNVKKPRDCSKSSNNK